MPKKSKYNIDREWLYHHYIELNLSAPKIAEMLGIDDANIERLVGLYGMSKRKHPELVLTKDRLYDLYYVQNMGIEAIARITPNIGVITIKRLLEKYNIPLRDGYEITSAWWRDEQNAAHMSATRKELWQDASYRESTISARTTEEAKLKARIAYSAHMQGISVDEWSHFLTDEDTSFRASREYKQWRDMVFRRDNYTCQCCGARSEKGTPVNLQAHHIQSFSKHHDLRLNVDNGITFCDACHSPQIKGSLHNLYGTQDVSPQQMYDYIAMKQTA